MLRRLRENLGLKAISLLGSIILWSYVTTDRFPQTIITRPISVDASPIGKPPADVLVRTRPEPIAVEVSGPKNEMDLLKEGDIKAKFDVHGARPGQTQLRITQFEMPRALSHLEVKGRQFVGVDVVSIARKTLSVTTQLGSGALGRRFTAQKVTPEWIGVAGAPDDVKRVYLLKCPVETTGYSINGQFTIRAEDRDGVEVTGIELTPPTVKVEMQPDTASATKTVVVSPVFEASPAPGFAISDIIVEPNQITLVGPVTALQSLSRVQTEPVSVAGLHQDEVKTVRVVLPDGVSIVSGLPQVKLTVRIKALGN